MLNPPRKEFAQTFSTSHLLTFTFVFPVFPNVPFFQLLIQWLIFIPMLTSFKVLSWLSSYLYSLSDLITTDFNNLKSISSSNQSAYISNFCLLQTPSRQLQISPPVPLILLYSPSDEWIHCSLNHKTLVVRADSFHLLTLSYNQEVVRSSWL